MAEDFNHELLCVLAGFGGQGVLFAGKIMANCGLLDGRHVSWMPSYGPEMRGGTANCSVSLSDEAIGSPFITKPTALIADEVSIPVIASGGCGSKEHILEVFQQTNASAALAASIFHYKEYTVSEVKEYLRDNGVCVR